MYWKADSTKPNILQLHLLSDLRGCKPLRNGLDLAVRLVANLRNFETEEMRYRPLESLRPINAFGIFTVSSLMSCRFVEEATEEISTDALA